MNTTFLKFRSLILIILIGLSSCNKDDSKPDQTDPNPKEELDYPFTLSDNKTMHRFEVAGVVYSGEVAIVHTLNNSTLLAIGFLRGQPVSPSGGVPWLP